jgi:hypothetical protein
MITQNKGKEADKASPAAYRYGAAGDKSNEQITCCRICARNGWPREPIDFQKVKGRLRSDGTFQAASWKLKDYFTGRQHQHKQRRAVEGSQ